MANNPEVRSDSTVLLFLRFLLVRWLAPFAAHSWKEAKANRGRLITGATIFLLILLLPSRHWLTTPPVPSSGLWPWNLRNLSPYPREDVMEELAARAPQDPFLQAYVGWAMSGEPWGEGNPRYEDLMRRFPRETWLAAHRSRFFVKDTLSSPSSSMDARIAGVFEQPLLDQLLRGVTIPRPAQGTRDFGPATDLIPQHLPPVELKTVPAPAGSTLTDAVPPDSSPPSSLAPPPASVQQQKWVLLKRRVDGMEEMLSRVRSGMRRDPDNAFWDLLCAQWLFALERDAEALKVVAIASRKTRFDSYSREYAKMRNAGLRQAKASSLAWGIADNTFHQEATWRRHFFHLVAWQAWLQEKRGRHAQALEISSNALRLARLMRRNEYWATSALAACAYEAILWGGVSRRVGWQEFKGKSLNGGWWLQRGSEKFAKYARSHGRHDLAREAISQGRESARERLALQSALKKFAKQGNFPLPRNQVRQLFVLGAVWSLLLLHFVLLVVWRVVVWILSPRDASAPLQVSPKQRSSTLALCLLITLAVAVPAISACARAYPFSWAGTPQEDRWLPILLVVLIAPLLTAIIHPTVIYVLRRMSQVDAPIVGFRLQTSSLTRLILVGSLLLIATGFWWLLYLASSKLRLPQIPVFEVSPLTFEMTFSSPMAGGLQGVFGFLGIALLSWHIVMQRRESHHRAERFQVLAWHRQTLSDWALGAASLLLVCGLMFSFVNRNAQVRIDEFENMGSRSWLLRQW